MTSLTEFFELDLLVELFFLPEALPNDFLSGHSLKDTHFQGPSHCLPFYSARPFLVEIMKEKMMSVLQKEQVPDWQIVFEVYYNQR